MVGGAADARKGLHVHRLYHGAHHGLHDGLLHHGLHDRLHDGLHDRLHDRLLLLHDHVGLLRRGLLHRHQVAHGLVGAVERVRHGLHGLRLGRTSTQGHRPGGDRVRGANVQRPEGPRRLLARLDGHDVGGAAGLRPVTDAGREARRAEVKKVGRVSADSFRRSQWGE